MIFYSAEQVFKYYCPRQWEEKRKKKLREQMWEQIRKDVIATRYSSKEVY